MNIQNTTVAVEPAGPPPMAPLPQAYPPMMDPLQQARAVLRYRWQILGICAVFILATLLAGLSVKPIYRATATVVIEPKAANVVSKIQQVDENANDAATEDYRLTQLQVLESRSLALAVAEKLQLTQKPQYARSNADRQGLLQTARDALRNTFDADRQSGSVVDPDISPEMRLVLDRLSEQIKVEVVPQTQMLAVNVDLTDPQLSAEIANALVAAYIEADLRSKYGVTEQASQRLNERLEELRGQLKQSEQALQDFYEREKLVNVGGARTLDEQDLSDSNQRLREARKRRTDLENVYRVIVRAGSNVETLQEIPVVQQEPLVQATKRTYLEAKQALVQAQTRYGEKHPSYVQARKRLDETQATYLAQLRLAADGIRSDYEVSRDTEQSLTGIVGTAKSKILKLDRKQTELDMLQREVSSNRELYNTFLTRLKETDSSQNLNFSRTHVVDRALVPLTPYKPRLKLWLITAAMLGLFLGLLYALLRDYLDDTIQSPVQLEEILRAPVLAVLPVVKGNTRKKLTHLTHDDPRSAFAEGMKNLRTALLLSDVARKHKKLLVTSTIPGEGKTSIALNLAQAFAPMEKTLLLECDLRKPRIAKALGLPDKSPGLCDLLAGMTKIEACIYRDSEGQHDVMPCGQIPPNPSELLASPQFRGLLMGLEKQYERIILDSPPCMPVSDALLLSRCVDGTLFLTQADSTLRRHIRGVARQFAQGQIPLLGVIINQFDASKHHGRDDYDAYYFSGEGYYGQ